MRPVLPLGLGIFASAPHVGTAGSLSNGEMKRTGNAASAASRRLRFMQKKEEGLRDTIDATSFVQ